MYEKKYACNGDGQCNGLENWRNCSSDCSVTIGRGVEIFLLSMLFIVGVLIVYRKKEINE